MTRLARNETCEACGKFGDVQQVYYAVVGDGTFAGFFCSTECAQKVHLGIQG